MISIKLSLPPLRKSRFCHFSILVLLLICPPFSHASNLFKYRQVSMGTLVEITLIGDNEENAEKAALQAFREVKRIETIMSPWIVSSDVSRTNRSAGKEWVKLSSETIEVIRKAQEISEFSNGGFDITCGPLIQLWRNAREKGIPPRIEELKEVIKLVNFKDLLINPEGKVFLRKRGMSIDLGGIAKGYAVDKAFDLLKTLKYRNMIVNIGGDLRVGGMNNTQPWSIGIQDPRILHEIMATLSITEGAVATSGDYEDFFVHQGKRYHHILDPGNGLPAEECQSVTIFCKDAMTADALATTVFILGPEKGYALCQKLKGIDCLIIEKEGKRILSPGLINRISFTHIRTP